MRTLFLCVSGCLCVALAVWALNASFIRLLSMHTRIRNEFAERMRGVAPPPPPEVAMEADGHLRDPNVGPRNAVARPQILCRYKIRRIAHVLDETGVAFRIAVRAIDSCDVETRHEQVSDLRRRR